MESDPCGNAAWRVVLMAHPALHHVCVWLLSDGYGGLAQLVEHLLCKQGVIGSNPLASRVLLADVAGLGLEWTWG